MKRFGWLIAGLLSFSGAASGQDHFYHSHWFYHTDWPQPVHTPVFGHHRWHHHFGTHRPEIHKKAPPAVSSDREAIEALRRLVERLERAERAEPSALERARAEVQAAERRLAEARANLARLEAGVALPRMIVRPEPSPTSGSSSLEQRLERMQREIEELRNEIRRSRK